MSIEVFQRFEKKYLVNENTFLKIIEKITPYVVLDQHNKNNELYLIQNLYYDTKDSELIRKCLNKPKYREKLRVRAYGEVSKQDSVFVEIKKKVNGVGNKRRTKMSLYQAGVFLQNGQIPAQKKGMNLQVVNEIKQILQTYQLQPLVYLSYKRLAYFGRGDRNFRISFDRDLLTRRTQLDLSKGEFGNRLLPENQWLMEVKVLGNLPIWFTKVLSELQLYPTGFSKYGEEYKRHCAVNQKTSSIIMPHTLLHTEELLGVR